MNRDDREDTQDLFAGVQGEDEFGSDPRVKTANEIAQDYGVHPVQVGQWQQAITAQAWTLFETKRGRKTAEDIPEADRLYRDIGRLKVELDWLKKSPG